MYSFQATGKQNRLAVVDALRGLALLGILLANLPFLADSKLYEARDFTIGSADGDDTLSLFSNLFIDKKFITIFSILFGFGFYVQQQRAAETGVAFRPYFFRRMLLLLLIGCIHAYLFWFGDIIRDYAICGMFLLLVCKWPAKRIFITGILFTVVLTGIVFIANGALGLQEYNYDRSIAAEHPLTGSYWRYLQINARIDPFVNFIQDSPITLVFCFGNMLMGYWLGKAGFFHHVQSFRVIRKRLIIAGATFGVFCSYLFWLVTSGRLELTPALIGLPFVIVAGMILQSLFYVSLFIHLFQYPICKKLLQVFAPVGKMALTNYMLQTFAYLLLFFHWTHGLQLYGRITRVETWLIAFLFFFLQALFSRWWMKSHQQGPVEWIWKKLAYQFPAKQIRVDEVVQAKHG